ncbi:MAG: glycosyltransferase family 4 protein [Gloeomargaritaceae cyanobacterium C42_A2020_066]|nr:glycosyltransferase family 4 protein [Gloeomargaritaceae cyanobacterium C42_A2020_066]
MRVLFVHQNFPGQYKHLAPAIAAPKGNEVMALCINVPPKLPGVPVWRYQVSRGTTPNVHPWVAETETKTIRGEACGRAALQIRQRGFVPDVICAHPGWGETLFLKDVFPEAKLLSFVEFHYGPTGRDMGFDPEFDSSGFEDFCRIRLKNAANLLSLDLMDWGLSPTHWQASTVPAPFQPRLSVIHDGVDTDAVCPNPQASITLGRAGRLTAKDEVITFVNRNLEPMRGFHIFMRAIPEIQARCPQARIVIIGGDGVSYGRPPGEGKTWRQVLLAELGDRIDLARVHFIGRVPYDQFLQVLQVSAVHVYLTYPFVLSWSMLEAMSTGALVIGSATPPVMEVIEDGVNGLLVDFFDAPALAAAIARVLRHPDRMQTLRQKARETVQTRYDLRRICLPQHLALVETLAAGRTPTPSPRPAGALQ